MNKVSIIEEPVFLLEIYNDILPKYKNILDKYLYSDNKFFSITRFYNKISIIASKDIITDIKDLYVPDELVCFDDTEWKLIRVYQSISDISKFGIIANISKLFADQEISILYITSYGDDYIMIDNKKSYQALKTLVKNKFEIEYIDFSE